MGQHTIGGIGQLWQGDHMLGAVYYNLFLQQPDSAQPSASPQDGDLVSGGELVFLGQDVELDPVAGYRLILEDARILDLTVSRDSRKRRGPYQLHIADGRIRPAP